LYSAAAEYAATRGLIIADTKFEFGLVVDRGGEQLILVNEALTPDSSRSRVTLLAAGRVYLWP
jgi:phosphoribosylaminoimidazole-succinocarboxamide synthase